MVGFAQFFLDHADLDEEEEKPKLKPKNTKGKGKGKGGGWKAQAACPHGTPPRQPQDPHFDEELHGVGSMAVVENPCFICMVLDHRGRDHTLP